MAAPSVAAQLNIHPNDVDYVPHLLPHQIRAWAPQVDRIHVTLDTHGVAAGHYRAVDLAGRLERMRAVLEELSSGEPKLVVDEIDTGREARREIARAWFDADDMPMKAWNGSPLYAYLFGISRARADFVVHFDGDMFFGGGSRTWVEEALARFRDDERAAFVGPLSGPPREDGALIGQGEGWAGSVATRERGPEPAYRFNTVSTRVFMTSLALLRERIGGAVPMQRPSTREWLFAKLLENPTDTIEPERLLSGAMGARGLHRVEMLGTAPGMWSLHPPFRTPEFFERLPELVERVETGDLPDGQRGRYDLGEPVIDWSAARRRKGRAARWRGHARHVLGRLNPLR